MIDNDFIVDAISCIRRGEFYKNQIDLRAEILKLFEKKINYLTYTYHVPGMDKEDLAQELRLAILNTFKKYGGFDKSLKVKFNVYIDRVLKVKIFWLIRNALSSKKRMSNTEEINDFTFGDLQRNLYVINKTIEEDKIFTKLILEGLKLKLKQWECICLDMLMANYTYDEILDYLFKHKMIGKRYSKVSITHLINRKCRRLLNI